jgi:polyribonucleotide nucleotidyltransferase
LGQDERGKIRLSMKVVDQETGEDLTEKLKAERDQERSRENQERGPRQAAGE